MWFDATCIVIQSHAFWAVRFLALDIIVMSRLSGFGLCGLMPLGIVSIHKELMTKTQRTNWYKRKSD